LSILKISGKLRRYEKFATTDDEAGCLVGDFALTIFYQTEREVDRNLFLFQALA